MVDVAEKKATHRVARARALIDLGSEIIQLIQNGELVSKKGVVFQTAIIAGVMGAKKTGELIPLCHPLSLENCQVEIGIFDADTVQVVCTASINGKTGVEMEALTGVSVAALTIYDMCKALSPHIVIREIRLLEKRGGKRDFKYQDSNL